MSIYYYSIVNDNCSCRGIVFKRNGRAVITDNTDEYTPIGSIYKHFYQRLKAGEKGVDICTDLNIMRSCCRIRLLSIPTIPMINRAENRVYINIDDAITTLNTKTIRPDNSDLVPTFPSQ